MTRAIEALLVSFRFGQPLSRRPFGARFAAVVAALGALLVAPVRADPYSTSAEGGDARLMLKGRDPVAYFTAGKPVSGSPAIKADFDGVTYRFASDGNKLEFQKNPLKFVPQFGGFCANSMSYALPYPGDPEAWKIIDGRLYLFGNERQRRYFLMDEDRNLKLARGYWKDEVENGIALLQRYRRLALRVSHYRSDKELEAEWQALNAPAGAAAAPQTPAASK
jgi:YHS domain-containing protein